MLRCRDNCRCTRYAQTTPPRCAIGRAASDATGAHVLTFLVPAIILVEEIFLAILWWKRRSLVHITYLLNPGRYSCFDDMSQAIHSDPKDAGDCMICCCEIEPSSYMEYRTHDKSVWKPCTVCSDCMQYMIDNQWKKFTDLVDKIDCRAAALRLCAACPTNVKEKVRDVYTSIYEMYLFTCTSMFHCL